MKDYGNKAFKSSDLPLGIEKYQKALRYLNEYPSATAADTDGDAGKEKAAELDASLTTLRFSCHSNSALLHNKLGHFEDAKASGDKAVAVIAGEKGWTANKGAEAIKEPERAKAYFRRAVAERGLKNDDAAIKDLEVAHKLLPSDGAIEKELEAARKKVREQDAREKKAFKKFFA